MSFLAPLFLAGIALVAGPILFHLIRQAPRNRVLFSSTEFLDPSPPRVQQRSRIQNPWLLLIRCLIIAILALAFARPFFNPENSSAAAIDLQRDLVVAVDASASMQRPGLWQDALQQTLALASELGPRDQLAVLRFDDAVLPLVEAEQWNRWPAGERVDRLAQQLETQAPAPTIARLDRALEAAVQSLAEIRETSSGHGFGEIAIVSDFASGSEISGIPGIEWPSEASLRRIQVGPDETPNNVGLRWLGWSEADPETATARFSLSHSRPSAPTEITLLAANALDDVVLAEPKTLFLEEKTEHLVTLELPVDAQNLPLRFSIAGDDLAFDNTLHVAPAFTPQAALALLTRHQLSDTKQAPYFIERALSGFASPETELAVNPAPPFAAFDAVIIDRPLSAPEAEALARAIEGGAQALVLAEDDSLASTLDALSANEGWQLGPTPLRNLLIGSVEFEHPLFLPFNDPRFSNFANLRIWQAIPVDPPPGDQIRSIASYDNQQPLLLEQPIGEGVLYVWAGSWRPGDSQWLLSTKFVPWLHRFVVTAIGGSPPPGNTAFSRSVPQTYAGYAFDRPLEELGLYQAAGPNLNRWIALQLPPAESDIAPISEEQWLELGLPNFDRSEISRKRERIAAELNRETAIEAEQRQGLWKWLLLAAIALLALESFIATRLNQQREAAAA